MAKKKRPIRSEVSEVSEVAEATGIEKKIGKEELVIETILNSEGPYEGLDLSKKEKYYNQEILKIVDRWSNQKKKVSVRKAMGELVVPEGTHDPRRTRIGMRLIRATEQFNPDYTYETVVVSKIIPRKSEDKVEELEVGATYYADWNESGSDKKTEPVKIIAVRGKDVLIETKRGLEYCKINHLFAKDLETKENSEVVGKTKAEVFRFIGIEMDAAQSPISIKVLRKGELYLIKCVFKLTKVSNKVIKLKETDGKDCFNTYGTTDPAASIIVPGRLIIRFHEGSIRLYAVLEKTPNKDGVIKKSFNLFEFTKTVSKKQPEKEIFDKMSKIENWLSGVDEEEEF